MSSFQLILVSGIVLGVVQLAAGYFAGAWLTRRKIDLPKLERDREQAFRVAGDVASVTASLDQSVAQHAQELVSIEQSLADGIAKAKSSGKGELPLTELVGGIIQQMMSAHRQLQQDLDRAHQELQLRQAEIDSLTETALTDPLTGLPNRRSLEDHMSSRLQDFRKHQIPFSMLMIDVDHFKKFNDTHGHLAGDAALIEVGQSVQAVLRKQDVVTRYGGEEFAVVLPHSTLEDGIQAAKKVVEGIQQAEITHGGKSLGVTASVGLASYGGHESTSSFNARADEALYAAKENGRNRAYMHDGEKVTPLPGANAQADSSAVIPTLESPGLQRACDDLKASLSDLLSTPKV